MDFELFQVRSRSKNLALRVTLDKDAWALKVLKVTFVPFILLKYTCLRKKNLKNNLLITKFPLNAMFSVKIQRKQKYLSQSCHVND